MDPAWSRPGVTSFDTNIAVYAANTASPWHEAACRLIQSLSTRQDVAVCDLVLVKLYLKLRNGKIFPRPPSAPQAAAVCQAYRRNRAWTLIGSGPVMEGIWMEAANPGFTFRRIIDVRLACTLVHHGMTEFATPNEKDFAEQGFSRVWNPLLGSQALGARSDKRPRSAGFPRLREPRFRSVRLRPFTDSRFASNHPSTNVRLPNRTPLVNCATRLINTSARTRRSLAVVNCSRTFSESPRLTIVPSSRFRAAP